MPRIFLRPLSLFSNHPESLALFVCWSNWLTLAATRPTLDRLATWSNPITPQAEASRLSWLAPIGVVAAFLRAGRWANTFQPPARPCPPSASHEPNQDEPTANIQTQRSLREATMPSVQLTDAELSHVKRWREYQRWLSALPPGLHSGPKALRNPHCSALGTGRGCACKAGLTSTRKA
jgi:hypothetical protein